MCLRFQRMKVPITSAFLPVFSESARVAWRTGGFPETPHLAELSYFKDAPENVLKYREVMKARAEHMEGSHLLGCGVHWLPRTNPFRSRHDCSQRISRHFVGSSWLFACFRGSWMMQETHTFIP